ncbi:hypothetical protein GM418_30675 [Maribellus comscasis]|uniref:Tetratricopeptide repeat protein n=1 Tax=Maribellus comscasis TaxID=2681766 RepID=A0A6I6JXT8_9BACT|nr:hypothetical protein [Maribellus comscasis]QGY47865.1 hypothetical protein GM418_30675 [Maribellus comscasis]
MESNIKSIQELENEFNKLDKSNSREYIKFYENNLESIHNIDIDKDEEHYNAKLRLDCEYGVSLVATGNRVHGAIVLEKAIQMFENAPNQDLKKVYSLPYFEQILWNYAYALSETNQLNRALPAFIKLNKHYSKENKYKSWVINIRNRRLKKFSKPLAPIALIWTILTFTLFQRFESITRFYLAIGLGIIVLFGVASEIYSVILKQKLNRIGNASQTDHPRPI